MNPCLKNTEELEAKLKMKDEVIAEIVAVNLTIKKSWGNLNSVWVEPNI